MKKSVKVTLGFLIVGVVLLWVLLLAVDMTEATLPSETIFPEGNLSESIFESQNNIYTGNEDLARTYSFYEVPYKVNVPDVKGATVGTGRMYDYDSNFLIYVGEYNKIEDGTGLTALTSQLGKAILIDAVDDACVMQNMASDEGYINGFAATYMSNIFYVSNGADKEKEVCLTAYNLTIEDNPEYNITLAVVSKTQSTQHLAMAKEILDIITGTCVYSEELEQLQIAQKEMEETEQEDGAQEEVVGVDEQEDTTFMPEEELLVSITEDYEDLVLYFNYSNSSSDVTACLYTPDKLNYYDYVTNNDGVMIFHPGKVSAGDYILKVTGDYGTGNVQLTENESPVFDTEYSDATEDNAVFEDEMSDDLMEEEEIIEETQTEDIETEDDGELSGTGDDFE